MVMQKTYIEDITIPLITMQLQIRMFALYSNE